MEYTKVIAAGASQGVGHSAIPATLAITADNRVILYSTDDAGGITGELFNSDGSAVKASGNQNFIAFTTAAGRFTVDFGFGSTTSLRVGGAGANLVAVGHELHRLDMLGWVKALRSTGARVRYIRMRTIVVTTLAIFFLGILPLVIWFATAHAGGFH